MPPSSRIHRVWFLRFLAGGALCLLALPTGEMPSGAFASSPFVVDSEEDAVDSAIGDGACATATGTCTLRAAVQESNAFSGSDTIEVPAGTYEITIPEADPFTDASGDFDIGDHATITGAGSGATIIDGGGLDRVLELTGGLSATISGVTVRNGAAPFGGGGIQSGGDLTLDDVVVSGNSAGIDGGGIATTNGSTLTATDSTITDNAATRDGGGVFAATGSVVTITRSTISGNSGRIGGGMLNRSTQAELTDATLSGNSDADGGGGLHNEGTIAVARSTLATNQGTNGGAIANIGTLDLTNSTLSANTASVSGGGIWNLGSASLLNVTIAGNSGVFAGGIDNNGTLTLKNTILEGGPSGANCVGAITSQGHNVSQGTSCVGSLTGPGDVNSHSALLEPLAANGGPTQTHALMEGSPAIDGGDAGCPATDQRGAARPQGASCDVGAFEVGEVAIVLRQGEIDCDAGITPRDALILLLSVESLPLVSRGTGCPEIGTGAPFPFGDVNCDGVVNALDALVVLAYRAGAVYRQEAGCTAMGQEL